MTGKRHNPLRILGAITVAIPFCAVALFQVWVAGWAAANWSSDDGIHWERYVSFVDSVPTYLLTSALAATFGISGILLARLILNGKPPSQWLWLGAAPVLGPGVRRGRHASGHARA